MHSFDQRSVESLFYIIPLCYKTLIGFIGLVIQPDLGGLGNGISHTLIGIVQGQSNQWLWMLPSTLVNTTGASICLSGIDCSFLTSRCTSTPSNRLCSMSFIRTS